MMKIVPRVMPSATLSMATGTIANRNKQIKSLEKGAFKWMYDHFESMVSRDMHPEVSLEELQDVYLQRHPGVITRVKPQQAKLWGGGVTFELLGSKRSVAGFRMDLSLENIGHENYVLDLLNPQHTEILFHEDRHLNDYLLHPKMLAKMSEYERLFYLDGKVGDKVDKFYVDNVYLCKAKGTSSRFSDKERRVNTKNVIKDFFKEQNLNSEQKIAILQHWRASVATEINARKSSYKQNTAFMFATQSKFVEKFQLKMEAPRCGLFDSFKIPEGKRIKALKDYCEKMFRVKTKSADKKFFYKEKLQILNAMLASEIKDHRQKHAARLKGIN